MAINTPRPQWEYLEVYAYHLNWIDSAGASGTVDTVRMTTVQPGLFAGLLDRYGQQGWELVSTASEGSGAGLRFYFKRPKA